MNYLKYAASFLIFLMQLLILFYLINNRNYDRESKPEQSRIVLRDTVLSLVPAKPIILEKIKPKIVYLRDTIIESKPFKATADTVINNDTLQAAFTFPENTMSLYLKPSADSVRIEKLFILPEQEKSPSWEKLLYIGAGAIIGILIKSL